MLHYAHRQTSPWRILVLAAVAAALGCGDQPTQPQVDGVSLAKGGGGNGGGDPKVRDTDPASAPQDTTLDVRVVGSGFEPGAVATFLLDGVATNRVHTNSTQFVGARELRANITIAIDAIVDLYDVEVRLAGPGRRGIGADLFAVVEKGSPFADNPENRPITLTFEDRTGDNVGSDGRGIYDDRACGVSALFNVYDARLVPDKSKIKPNDAENCGGRDPRNVMVAFTAPVGGSQPGGRDGSTVGANFFKVDEVEQVTVADGTVLQTAVIHGAGCAHGLQFNPNLDPLSSSVEVTMTGNGTWTVATQAFPDNVAVCIPNEDKANPPPRSYYHMPFSITVTLKQ